MEFLKRCGIKLNTKHTSENAPSPNVDRQEYCNKEPAQGSLIVQSFIWYARLGRFFGCLFIKNLSDKSLDKATAPWKSFYTLYSAAWLSMLVFFEGSIIFEASECRKNSICKFTESLGVISHCAAAIKTSVNFLCLAGGCQKLLKFLSDAVAFERSNSYILPYQKLVRSRSWFNMLLKLAALASLLTTLCSVLVVHFSSFSSSRVEWHPVLKSLAICSCFSFAIYESFMYVALTRLSEVLAHYVQLEVERFEEYKRTEVAFPANAERRSLSGIEAIRLNVCKIKRLKAAVNEIWAPAIVTTSACLVVMLCNALYSSFHITPSQVQAWAGVTYAIYCTLSFVDMVLVTDHLRSQAQKLKDAAKTLTMLDSSDSYTRQVHYLHDVINPEDMYLSGAGFCRLDRPLLVMMAGSGITFTVILVQTSEDLKPETEMYG